MDRKPRRLIRWPEVSGVGYIGLFLAAIGLASSFAGLIGVRGVAPGSYSGPYAGAQIALAAFFTALLDWGWAIAVVGASLFAFDMAVGWEER